ncbi:MAG: metal-sulfur cluster assembly factor [Anaerolineae bacterium]|nr:metal-sulfur cluster assembly factor [Caldilineales bacterium]MDW8269598.1 metal-sulfur cluster assembly factor [Anaerolineae bacterium]
MPTVEEIREALKSVRDPELMLDIINLGLVYDITIHPDNRLDVDMTLTSPGCPAGPQILNDAYRVLRTRFPEFDEVNINLVWVPFWNPDMMSQEAKEELGIF